MTTDEDESAETADDEDVIAGMYDQSDDQTEIDTSSDDSDAPDPGDDDSNSGLPGGSPLLGGDDRPEMSTGTFYVKHTEETAVTLHEVHTAQIFTLVENPDLEPHQIIEATLIAQPPMEISYVIDELESQRTIPVETSNEPPTRQVMEMGAEMETGQAAAIERAGTGEIHILAVDPEQTAHTAEDVTDDEMTYKNAARYGIDRVEIRTDDAAGIVSIRYLPD